MKSKFTLLFSLLFFAFAATAQQQFLPNGSFEVWTNTSPSYPDSGWDTGDHLIHELSPALPQRGWCTKDTNPANVVAGSASCRLFSDTVPVVNQIAPGTVAYSILALDANNNPYPIALPFTGRPTVFSGNFKYAPATGDSAQYQLYLTRWDSVSGSEIAIASLNKFVHQTNGAFIAFNDTLQYQSNLAPDSIILIITSSQLNNPIAGSILWVDNLAFTYLATGIQHFSMDDAVRVFPNPAGSSVTITVDDYMAGYTMHIYDLSGRLVKQQVIESATYSFSIAGLAGGQYIYALSNKDGNQVYKNKLSVIK